MKIPTFVPIVKTLELMWQRIQTLYLGISTALIAAMFFCRFATIAGPEGSEIIIRYYEKMPYLVLMIMLLSANIASVSTFRMFFLQARVCVIAGLLSLGFQIWLGIDFLRFHGDMTFSVSLLFPLVAAFLNFVAAHKSMVDEMTVQAVRGIRKSRKNRK